MDTQGGVGTSGGDGASHAAIATAARASPPNDTAVKPTSNGSHEQHPRQNGNASPVPPDASMEDGEIKSDSEAETIVLAGKDGHSPEKLKKTIKHEIHEQDPRPMLRDASNGVTAIARAPGDQSDESGSEKASEGSHVPSSLGKRKRGKSFGRPDHDPASSSPADVKAVASLVASSRSGEQGVPRNQRPPPSMETQRSRSKSPSPAALSSKSLDANHTKQASRQSSAAHKGDELEARDHARKQTPSHERKTHQNGPLPTKLDMEGSPATNPTSPPLRHKRSDSIPSSHRSNQGLGHKKKRIPAPLQSTENESDDSSASEDDATARTSRSIAHRAPRTAESAMSPAKLSHKRHVNSSGQTLLARACSSGKLEQARERHKDHPETLDQADNANNTPLHFASISGHVDIVRFLLDAGCRVEPVNDSGDAPLHDAVENNHLEVVELLLAAGANPRRANKKGDEPTELISEDFIDSHGEEDAIAMRRVLEQAKRKGARLRRSPDNVRRSYPQDSPRQSPVTDSMDTSVLTSSSRGTGTIRSQKTSNHLLFEGFTVEELRKAASSGDETRVATILSVNPNHSDTKTLILAAKGGHDGVISILFGMGQFDHDPQPLQALHPDTSTPMLAAIGRDKPEVIKLLLSQADFDPTRRIGGETYAEIAKRRAGPRWSEEEAILAAAIETYKKSPKVVRKQKLSRARREPDIDTRHVSKDESLTSRPQHKRKLSSPTTKSSDPSGKQHKRSSSTDLPQDRDRNSSARRTKHKDEVPARPARLDLEPTALAPPKRPKYVSTSGNEPISSDSEIVKPRRKLVSGHDLKDGRDRQRRPSGASTTSNASTIDKSVSNDAKMEDYPEKKAHDPKAASRTLNKSSPKMRDRELKMGDRARSLKREESKDRASQVRNEKSPIKRHRDSATPPKLSVHDSSSRNKQDEAPPKRRRLENDSKLKTDLEMPSSSGDARPPGSKTKRPRDVSASSVRQSPANEQTSLPRQKADGGGEAQNYQARSNQVDENHQQARDSQSREVTETKARAAREEAERLRMEAVRKQDERRAQEREAQIRADAERKRLLEEQEERKREEAERKRAAAIEQARLERVEREKQLEAERLSRLPLLLRWFDQLPDSAARSAEFATALSDMDGFRLDTIKPEYFGSPAGREQWLLSTHVALLLGEKDLQLSQYTAWDRIRLTDVMKRVVWRTESLRYSVYNPESLRKQVQKVWPETEIRSAVNEAQFLGLDLFFVKVTDFMFIVPRYPHLRQVEIKVHYRELPDCTRWPAPMPINPLWYRDPGFDAENPAHRMLPPPKHYRNGQLIRSGVYNIAKISRHPPKTIRVPRRGLIQVFPDDPEYAQLCKEQGLSHLLTPSPDQHQDLSEGQLGAIDQTQPAVVTNGDAGSLVSPAVNGGHGSLQSLANGVDGAGNDANGVQALSH